MDVTTSPAVHAPDPRAFTFMRRWIRGFHGHLAVIVSLTALILQHAYVVEGYDYQHEGWLASWTNAGAGHWLGAALGAYVAMAALLGRTVVTLSGGALDVRRGPLPVPFLGDLELPRARIAGFRMITRRGGRTSDTFTATAVLTDRRTQGLVTFAGWAGGGSGEAQALTEALTRALRGAGDGESPAGGA